MPKELKSIYSVVVEQKLGHFTQLAEDFEKLLGKNGAAVLAYSPEQLAHKTKQTVEQCIIFLSHPVIQAWIQDRVDYEVESAGRNAMLNLAISDEVSSTDIQKAKALREESSDDEEKYTKFIIIKADCLPDD